MIVTPTNAKPAYFTAALFYDYLSLKHADYMALMGRTVTTQTRAGDIPDDLQRLMMDMATAPTFPSLLVVAREETDNTSARRSIELMVMLCTWMNADDAKAASVAEMLTSAQSSAIENAVEMRLRDVDSFNAWLATQSEERLTGWNIISPMPVTSGVPERGRKDRTVDFVTIVKLVLAWAPRLPG